MRANPYPTYEDAAQHYRTRFRSLIQLPQEVGAASGSARGGGELPAEALSQKAEEIAGISSSMIRLAQGYLDSADPMIREGIRGHLIDQATVELLLAAELIRITDEETGLQSTAASRATQGAVLREAIGAADQSSAVAVTQGLPIGQSYRSTESATIEEAASALRLAVATTASSISHRVQELGKDIAFDLVAGTPWAELEQGMSLSGSEIAEALGSIHKDPAARILSGVYEKVAALLDTDIERAARVKIREWLAQIKQADKVEGFDALVEGLFEVEALKKTVANKIERPPATLESLNRTADQVKAISDKFLVLTGRMRKLEEAIRLGKLIRVPQLLLTMTALQVALLAALVYAGQDYIKRGVAGILQERGFLEP